VSTTYTPAVPAEFVGLARQFLRDAAREHEAVRAVLERITAPVFTRLGVPPAVLRFYTVAYCTPCHPRPLGSVRGWRCVGFLHRAGRIARHVDPWDRDPAYGVQYAASIRNVACILHCTP
jgi:hypothetical protein